jgi:hypothetical protein
MPRQPTVPSRKDLGRLQQALLEAVLNGEPLPGGGPAQLADLGFVLRHARIHLLDEGLVGRVALEGARKPVAVVSVADLRREARAHGDIGYLHFLPPEADDAGEVWLTLEGRLVTADTGREPASLSRLQVKLRRLDGRWELTSETRALAG